MEQVGINVAILKQPAPGRLSTEAIEEQALSRKEMVPRRGLEPPRLAAQVPETCASTNSAIWATESHVRGWLFAVNRVFEVFLTVCEKAS